MALAGCDEDEESSPLVCCSICAETAEPSAAAAVVSLALAACSLALPVVLFALRLLPADGREGTEVCVGASMSAGRGVGRDRSGVRSDGAVVVSGGPMKRCKVLMMRLHKGHRQVVAQHLTTHLCSFDHHKKLRWGSVAGISVKVVITVLWHQLVPVPKPCIQTEARLG